MIGCAALLLDIVYHQVAADNEKVAEFWKQKYDLRYILERDWKTVGPKLRGKIHICVGDMDNYYHQMYIPRAVKRMEQTAPQDADLKSWRY